MIGTGLGRIWKQPKRRTKYKHSFDTLIFKNRWTRQHWDRPASWLIFGICRDFFSPTEYQYRIAFFGFDFCFWFKRTPIN